MEETKEVSNIQDEDVLRRMWQATEDFSKKKEIRAHMYKLREARLKEFYTSGEVLKDVQRSNSSPGLRDQPCGKDEGPTHADSLADHSFLSLKTKEVRDSESPTRDVQFRNSKNRDVDGQWTITSNTSTSPDGKTITSSQKATTQGIRPVDGGQLSYAAANEHQASVYADGDDRNFTRSRGEASNTFAEENVVSGDDNNFRSSKKTTKSSSSRTVTEHRSQTGDFGGEQLAITAGDDVDNAFRTSKSTTKSGVTKTTYTSGDIPEDLQKSIADGNTKVFTETKTLPDGSTVTTTRYETRGTKKVGSTVSSRQTVQQSVQQDKNVDYDDSNYKTVTKTTREVDIIPTTTSTTSSSNTKVTRNRQTVEQFDNTSKNDNIDDGSYTIVTKTIREIDTEPTISEYVTSRQTVQQKSSVDTRNVDNANNYKTVVTKTIRESDTRPTHSETIQVTNNRQTVQQSTDKRTDNRSSDNRKDNKVVTTTIVREVDDHRPLETEKPVYKTKESPAVETIVTKTTVTETVTSDDSTPRHLDQPLKSPKEKPQEIKPKEVKSPQEKVKSCKPQESYHPSSPTEGQYSTTYRSEFTNKKISVEVSATHDAFARSLRSISPDRIGDRPKSRGSVSSLRSSPEKHPKDDRRSPDRRHNTSPCRQEYSPERKQYSPERKQYSPERKQYSPERKHYSPEQKQYSPERKQNSPERKQYSPERKPSRPDSITVTRTTETITKRRPSDKSSPTSPTKTKSPSPTKSPVSPTKDSPTKKIPTDERKSPVRSQKTPDDSPVKSRKTPDESPVRSPTKPEVNSDTITRKKKITTEEINTDTITRKSKTPDDRRSPVKHTTTEIITVETRNKIPDQVTTMNTDTITRKKSPTDDTSKTEIINTDTITRTKKKPESVVIEVNINRKKPHGTITTEIDDQIITETVDVTDKTKRPISRDLSSTSLASDIEFINHNSHIVTDLDEPTDGPDSCTRPEKRPSTLEITETIVTTTEKKLASSPGKSPVKSKSPTKEHPKEHAPKEPSTTSPVKEVPSLKKVKPSPELDSPDKPPTNFNIEDFEQVCEVTPKERPPLKRTETYEERCRQMLGLPEPDEIVKKDYDDMYAGMEPVEEPLFVKKNVTPLGPIGPDDQLIHDSVRKINKRREEIPEDVKPNIEEFIVKEQIETVDAKKPKPSERKSPEKEPLHKKVTKTPEQKSPTSPDRKPSVDRKSPTKSASPDRKSPKKSPGQYNTEYTDEYCERPNEPTRVTTTKTIKLDRQPSRESSPKKYTDNTTKTDNQKKPRDGSPKKDFTDTTKKVPEKKPSRESSPQKEHTTTTRITTTTSRRPSKGSPERKPKQDMEFTTEYTEEYCEITGKKITRPAGKKSEPKEKDIAPIRGIPSPRKAEKTPEKKPKPVDDDTDDENIERINRQSPDRYNPSRTLPENVTVTQYINDYTPRPNDFISREKHDTDITLTTNRTTNNTLQNIEFNLETENVQETHTRTHRIDSKPREVSPKRVPQKAVPTDTMECSFKKPDGPKKAPVAEKKAPVVDKKAPTDKKSPVADKKAPVPDRKSPVKQLKDKKDSSTKIVTTTTKTVTKKVSSAEIDLKKSPETSKKTPEKPRVRSPSPTSRTTLKKAPEPKKDLPKKVSSSSLVHKPLNKPLDKPQDKPKSSKHLVTKTISVTSPVKTITKPSSVTIKTSTKTVKKTTKLTRDNYTSDSEPEVDVVVVTNGVAKKPDVTMPSYKVNDQKTKCITTKSIILNNEPGELEFVIDLQRSTSSREPSVDKICPIPVSDDEGSHPRYPDQVSEPDDQPFRRPVKITDIPLTEEEDVHDFNRITEVNKRITDIDMVTETDESLLSVTEKVSKFITTSEKLIDNEPKTKAPAPKVPRPELIVDRHLENDECLLSVSDKVSKFITTAEQIQSPERPKSPRPKSPRPKDKTPVDVKVNENDECLLSVNQKVSHFITAAETSKKAPTRDGPAPKVARPDFKIDDTLKTDECLLSVSDKVNKFLTSAEKLTTKTEINVLRQSPERATPSRREPTPTRRESTPTRPESTTKSDYTPTRRDSTPSKREPTPTRRDSAPSRQEPTLSRREPTTRRDSTPTYEPTRQKSPEKLREPSPEKSFRKTPDLVRKSPEKTTELLRKSPERTPDLVRKFPAGEPKYECKYEPKYEPKSEPKNVNLKSSEAVKKAKAMFENISKNQEVPKQRDILSRPSVWEGRRKPEKVDKPEKPEEEVKLTDIGVYTKECRTTDLKDVTLKSTKLVLNESKPTRYLSPEKDIPGYMRPTRSRSPNPLQKPYEPNHKPQEPSQKPHEYIQRPDEHIHRSRSPINPDIPGYMRPIPKVSPEERDQIILETRYREILSPERETKNTVVETFETETYETQKRQTTNGDVPHYMLPLQRNISPERDVKKVTETIEIIETPVEIISKEKDLPGYMRPLQRHAHSPERSTDVVDESRAEKKFGVTLRRTDSGRMVTTTTERRRSSTPGTAQTNIEEIEDLEVLEKMMDKVVGYEQRRRIRSQIRVVKKLISDNKLVKSKKIVNPTREPIVSKPCDDRRSPIREPKRSSVSPSKTTGTTTTTTTTTITTRQRSPEPKPKSSVTTTRTTKERSVSPEAKKKPATPNMYKTDLKRVQPTVKASIVQEDKPSWVTNRNLKKTTETVEKRTVSSSTKKVETARRSPSPQKDSKPTDCITSSYGIGPTDENGLPLFGIRALRKAADTKVQIKGTVVTSQFYSENGEEPVGEVTVTKYSNNPKELNIDDEQINKTKGITSVTTTQKFGTRGTPTLSSLVDKKKAIMDKEDEILKTTPTKVTRRGSVKALSQKFIENAVESIQKEKQSYPKAGLILRTSSFKETTNNDRNSSRESSPGYTPHSGKVSLDSITSDSRSTIQSSTDQSKTFLNSHTKVASAQEVITRMKNAESEYNEGDSAEDREARMLLNKFLGAQVLMSGMEPLLSTQSTTVSSSTSSSSAQLVRKVQKKTVTSSTKESSKPLSLTKRYQTPITPEILEDIWDEQTLRALLEQCTDYDERRAIRARLRQVMAEQEAVANVVASAVSDASSDRVQERFETTKKTFSEGPVTTTQVSTTRVVQQSRQVSKPISPFAKFRQLDKQNSLNTPPSSPRTPTGTGAPMFKFTDPALSQSASTVKERLLHWAQMKTKEYQNIKLENFSTSWADGMAFCALIHHFLPDAFDYHALNPKQRRHNFTLAFKVADEQADIAPLLDVDDMVAMRRPDWKCVFTYVQSIYRRFKDED